MTNEVAATATVVDRLSDTFCSKLGAGQSALDQALAWLTEKGVAFAVDILVAVLILLAGWLVIALLNKAITKALMKRGASRSLLAKFVCSVVSKSCWAVLLVMVLGQLGVNVGPLIAGLGVTGFILGFAFQESLGNLASGLMIALNEPFKVGDYVTLAGLEGSVAEVNMMATVLVTGDNKRIVVPNKSVWGSPITNFSALAERRVDIVVGVDYGADIAKAKAVALEAVRSLDGVLADPAPMAEAVSLDDNQVTLSIRVWAKNADYWKVFFGATQKVKDSFDANAIPIPFPQLDVHLSNS